MGRRRVWLGVAPNDGERRGCGGVLVVAAGELLQDPLHLVVEECGVGEVPQRLSTTTRPTCRTAAWGAMASITGYEGGEVNWVRDITELL
jgi:hypothetical protein